MLVAAGCLTVPSSDDAPARLVVHNKCSEAVYGASGIRPGEFDPLPAREVALIPPGERSPQHTPVDLVDVRNDTVYLWVALDADEQLGTPEASFDLDALESRTSETGLPTYFVPIEGPLCP